MWTIHQALTGHGLLPDAEEKTKPMRLFPLIQVSLWIFSPELNLKTPSRVLNRSLTINLHFKSLRAKKLFINLKC
jgi:hypothetical protein